VLLRVSIIGSRRKSALSGLDQIEGASDRGRAGPVPADEVEHCKPVLVGGACVAQFFTDCSAALVPVRRFIKVWLVLANSRIALLGFR
jgi:hypothetical protein